MMPIILILIIVMTISIMIIIMEIIITIIITIPGELCRRSRPEQKRPNGQKNNEKISFSAESLPMAAPVPRLLCRRLLPRGCPYD